MIHTSHCAISINRMSASTTQASQQPSRRGVHVVDAVDLATARRLGILRSDVEVNMDEMSAQFGVAYDRGCNVAVETYPSRKVLLSRCREFATSRGFALRVGNNSWNKNKQEGNAKYVCKKLNGQQQLDPSSDPDCVFFVNVYGKNNQWKITKISFCHDHHKFVGFQTATFVEGELRDTTSTLRQRDVSFATLQSIVESKMLPAYRGAWSDVKGKAIVACLLDNGHEVSRQVASKLKMAVLDSLQGDMLENYQKVGDYLHQVVKRNEGSHYSVEQESNGTFKRACIFPSACLRAVRTCKKVIGVDGTHLKGDMNKRGIYLLATAKDVDNHIVVFGLALVPVENYDNWSWFLAELKTAVRQCADRYSPVFVSDRQKGLLAAVSNIFPESGHRFCVRHIIGNVAKQLSALTVDEQGYVFAMARSDCEKDYDYFKKKLAETHAKAVSYLDGIPKEHWVTYAFNEKYNAPSFDEVTSNLSESANNWLGDDCRSAKPLHAFEEYMIKIASTFAERRRIVDRVMTAAAFSTSEEVDERVVGSGGFQPLVTSCQAHLESLLQSIKTCDVIPLLEGQYMVRFTDSSTRPGHVHIWRSVNLPGRECTCSKWQDTTLPCIHALKAAVRNG